MDGDDFFTVTHPFHPLFRQTFRRLAQRPAWGESRIFFADPETNQVRSLPVAWTDLAPSDPFVLLAAGRAILRLIDVWAVVRLLDDYGDTGQEVPS